MRAFRLFIAKLLSCWILKKSWRKNVRNFLFYFSLADYIKFRRQKFHIVSLGNNCLPRVLFTAIKLKPRKIYGEKTCPFDLCISNDIKSITELIKNNFKDYFVGLEFINNEWVNKKLNCIYIHDRNLNYIQFKKRYNKRIKNFINLLHSSEKIYFVYSNYNSEKTITQCDIQNLYNILKLKRCQKPFELILLTPFKINGLENIIQIVDNIDINDADWGVNMINQYNYIDNKYTHYMDNVFIKLKDIIK